MGVVDVACKKQPNCVEVHVQLCLKAKAFIAVSDFSVQQHRWERRGWKISIHLNPCGSPETRVLCVTPTFGRTIWNPWMICLDSIWNYPMSKSHWYSNCNFSEPQSIRIQTENKIRNQYELLLPRDYVLITRTGCHPLTGTPLKQGQGKLPKQGHLSRKRWEWAGIQKLLLFSRKQADTSGTQRNSD